MGLGNENTSEGNSAKQKRVERISFRSEISVSRNFGRNVQLVK